MANSCTWKLVGGIWTITATNCDDGKVCARIFGGMNLASVTHADGSAPKVGDPVGKGAKVKDADFRAAVNASVAEKRKWDPKLQAEGISLALALQDETEYEMECV